MEGKEGKEGRRRKEGEGGDSKYESQFASGAAGDIDISSESRALVQYRIMIMSARRRNCES